MLYRCVVPLCFLVLLSGCESLELSREELIWQGVHAMDIAQTLNAADDPCYKESAYITQRLIGEQPSDAEVMAWGIGTAIGHAVITQALERLDAPGWVQTLWAYGTISHTAFAVASNHDEGIRMWGDNQDVRGCYR